MQKTNHWLRYFSTITVVAAFSLILIGSLVTTNGAGMAFADWPLSSGSLNPNGWWHDFPQRLEHSHRLFAELTATLVGILCAWVWGNVWAFPAAVVASGALSMIAKFAGAPGPIIAHVGLWSAALVFAGMILFQSRSDASARPPLVRWLAFAAFCGVLVQAILGGFRVMIESGGNPQAAMIFRIVHGCFAQVEFGLLVVITSLLSFPATDTDSGAQITRPSRLRNLAWITFGFIFIQLIVGATMRHMGAGLAISTFPQATQAGGWMPTLHTPQVETNFAHTRVLALLVAIHVFLLVKRVFRSAGTVPALTRPAWLLIGLVAVQIILGVTVILTYRRVVPTTLHVINGAAIFATSLLLAVRASGFSRNAVSESHFSGTMGRATA